MLNNNVTVANLNVLFSAHIVVRAELLTEALAFILLPSFTTNLLFTTLIVGSSFLNKCE
jgi:hypothetical protein